MVRNVCLLNKLDAFQNTAFLKLFEHFKKKYYSLGRMRGTVSLKDFSAEEIAEIAGFLGVSAIQLERKGKVTLQQFEEQLMTSAFSHMTLKELIETILNEQLETKIQKMLEQENVNKNFVQQLESILTNYPAWLQQILKRESDSRFIWQQQATILRDLEIVSKALEQHLIYNQFMRLPLFAQKATGNPHAFDTNTVLGKLLVHAAFSLNKQHIAYPKNTEERVDLLATLKIVQDDLWNFVTVQGLVGYTHESIHKVWEAANQTKSALNMPIRELLNITRVQPLSNKSVYIVENSSVASTLMDINPEAPIICTHGQVRMAGWRLLDLLDSDVAIYYAGDLDPEGLHIAQNILKRYGSRVNLWRMDVQCYQNAMSETLSDDRLAKLKSIAILPNVVEQMQQNKKAAYQEAWIDLLIEDIQRNGK